MVRWVIFLFICTVFMNINQALPQGEPCIQENISCMTAPYACCDGLRCDQSGSWTCKRGSGPVPGPGTSTTTTTPKPHGSSSSSLYHHTGHLVLPTLLILKTLARFTI